MPGSHRPCQDRRCGRDRGAGRGRAVWVGWVALVGLLVSAEARGQHLGHDRPRVPVVLPPIRPRPGLDFWDMHTRECAQEIGADVWSCLEIGHLEPDGSRDPRTPAELLTEAATRPVVILIHGNRYDYEDASDASF